MDDSNVLWNLYTKPTPHTLILFILDYPPLPSLMPSLHHGCFLLNVHHITYYIVVIFPTVFGLDVWNMSVQFVRGET